MPGLRRRVMLASLSLAAVFVAMGIVLYQASTRHAPGGAPPPASTTVAVEAPGYTGSAVCTTCHAREAALWQGSQHAHAMQPAGPQTVLGDFGGRRFADGHASAEFERRGAHFLVRTTGPDGRAAEFPVEYTFGVAPLQQYLLRLPRGRLQSLTIAWDARPAARGGQRWINLYPGESIAADDPLHWSGREQNWNYQCADCHATNLRKNYDAATDTFSTTWSELTVGCEACHGPGSRHVAWARAAHRSASADANANVNVNATATANANANASAGGERVLPANDPSRVAMGNAQGLTAALDERHGAGWVFDSTAVSARRTAPRTSAREIEVCARCHSRRGQFRDAHVAGEPLHDAFRPALIEPPLYWPDGQMREEVYNYGSFLVSRMAARGVTCADCHEPHGQRLRAEGNAVCGQCHRPDVFDAPAHHHHVAGSEGARCSACHMPVVTYMQVDPRHDHGFRIPRPDRSIALGVPNACGQCHADRGPAWAAAAIRRWYPEPKPGQQDFAEAFAAADRGEGRASAALRTIASDPAEPALVRASALWRLGRAPSPGMLPAVRQGLADPDVNLRVAAIGALAAADPPSLAAELGPRLADPSRLVRMEAARVLAGQAETQLTPDQRRAFDAALAEYLAALRFNADRPEAHTELAMLHTRRGEAEAAQREFDAALRIDRRYVPAWVNLADVLRSSGHEAEAERRLREGLAAMPADASLHHALGLSLVRSGRSAEALGEFATAAKEAPDVARFAWVHAVALHSAGRIPEALAVLDRALARHPADRDVLMALATMNLESSRTRQAEPYLRRLAELHPEDPAVIALLRDRR